jgi:hypothetical protein
MAFNFGAWTAFGEEFDSCMKSAIKEASYITKYKHDVTVWDLDEETREIGLGLVRRANAVRVKLYRNQKVLGTSQDAEELRVARDKVWMMILELAWMQGPWDEFLWEAGIPVKPRGVKEGAMYEDEDYGAGY